MPGPIFTFVIDIHGNLGNLAVAAPFFYAVDSMKLVEMSRYDVTRIKEAGENVQRYLEGHFKPVWQAIFLVDAGYRHNNLLARCIFYQLIKIRTQFLGPLRESGFTPENIIILAVDPCNREPNGKPSNREYTQPWELDSYGFLGVEQLERLERYLYRDKGCLRDGPPTEEGAPARIAVDQCNGDFLFTAENIARIWCCWGKKLAVRDERFGEGPRAYSKELNTKLRQRKKMMTLYVDKLIEAKRNSLLKNAFCRDDSLLVEYFLESWKKIKKEFAGELERILDYAESYKRIENFNPSRLLGNIIADHTGLNTDAVKRDFTILRYSLSANHDLTFQKKIIELAFLLIALAEDSQLSMQLQKTPKHLFSVGIYPQEIDSPAFSKRLLDYRDCLRYNLDKLDAQMNTPTEVTLTMTEPQTEKCDENLDKMSMRKPQFDFYSDNGSVVTWRNWLDDVKQGIDNTCRQANRKVNRCLELMRLKQPVLRDVDVTDVRDFAEKREAEYQYQLSALPKETTIAPDRDFKSSVTSEDAEVKRCLKSRPYRKLFFQASGLIFLVFMLGFVFQVKFQMDLKNSFEFVDVLDLLIWCGFGFLVVFGAGYLTRRDFENRIQHLVDDTAGIGGSIYNRIASKFEAQKQYLFKLFNLNIARENAKKAQQAYLKESETKRISVYHSGQLKAHLDMAKKLCDHFPLTDPTYEGTGNGNYRDLQQELPPFQNHIYSPATFSVTPPKHGYDVSLDNVVTPKTSRRVFGIEQIHFNQDSTYANDR